MEDVRKQFAFKGMMAPTFAPFKEDGSLNLALIPRYAQILNDTGISGVYLNGSLGEGMSMTTAERKELVEAWTKSRSMIGELVVQVGGTSVKDSQEMARHAASLGVSAIACLPPLYDKPTTISELVDYCKEIASAAPGTPFLYYHIPCKTGVELPMDEFLEVAALEIPSMAGMKFTSMEVETEGARCLKAAGGIFTILSGFDETLAKARRVGFPGAINGCFNFMGLEAGRLICLAGLADDDTSTCCVPKEERLEEIQRLQDRIIALWDITIKQSAGSNVSGAKYVMSLLTGLNVGRARKPQQPLTTAAAAAIKAGLQEAGFTIIEN